MIDWYSKFVAVFFRHSYPRFQPETKSKYIIRTNKINAELETWRKMKKMRPLNQKFQYFFTYVRTFYTVMGMWTHLEESHLNEQLFSLEKNLQANKWHSLFKNYSIKIWSPLKTHGNNNFIWHREKKFICRIQCLAS